MEEQFIILIIEDNIILAEEIKYFLEKWGYDPII